MKLSVYRRFMSGTLGTFALASTLSSASDYIKEAALADMPAQENPPKFILHKGNVAAGLKQYRLGKDTGAFCEHGINYCESDRSHHRYGSESRTRIGPTYPDHYFVKRRLLRFLPS